MEGKTWIKECKNKYRYLHTGHKGSVNDLMSKDVNHMLNLGVGIMDFFFFIRSIYIQFSETICQQSLEACYGSTPYKYTFYSLIHFSLLFVTHLYLIKSPDGHWKPSHVITEVWKQCSRYNRDLVFTYYAHFFNHVECRYLPACEFWPHTFDL